MESFDMKKPIWRCTFCCKDTKTKECEHCGNDVSTVDRTQPHAPEWSRATSEEVECKVCDRRAPYTEQGSSAQCHPVERMPDKGFEVLNPGHKYRLGVLDGAHEQILQFVKRWDWDHPEKFPGNDVTPPRKFPGTTLQCVIRVLLDRIDYLQNQVPCLENDLIKANLRTCLVLLEKRAARRHGLDEELITYTNAYEGVLCPECGHVLCQHNHQD